MIHRPRRLTTHSSTSKTDDLIHLWILRLLVPLGAYREIVKPEFITDDSLAEAIGLGKWVDCKNSDFDPKLVRDELRRLHIQAEKNLRGAIVPPELAGNVKRMAELVGLSAVDCRILEFAVLIHNERLLNDAADKLGDLSSAKLFHALSILLELSETEIRAALSPQGTLAKSGLVSVDRAVTRPLRKRALRQEKHRSGP